MDIAGIALSMFIAICAIASAHVVARALKSYKVAREDLQRALEPSQNPALAGLQRALLIRDGYSRQEAAALHPYREAEEVDRIDALERRVAELVARLDEVQTHPPACIGGGAHSYHEAIGDLSIEAGLCHDRVSICSRCGGTVKW